MAKSTKTNKGATTVKATTDVALEPQNKALEPELSTYDNEVNKRIVPSQPAGGEKQQDAEEAVAEVVDEVHLGIVARYAKHYPANKVFYISTDKQVFLETSLNDAKSHQHTLTGNAGDLVSLSVK